MPAKHYIVQAIEKFRPGDFAGGGEAKREVIARYVPVSSDPYAPCKDCRAVHETWQAAAPRPKMSYNPWTRVSTWNEAQSTFAKRIKAYMTKHPEPSMNLREPGSSRCKDHARKSVS